jgi:hypothetical protein
MAKLIMSALAKEPEKRPSSAGEFASALRASSEGPGALLRRAFALYSEHFNVFIRASLLAFLPVICARILQVVVVVLKIQAAVPPKPAQIVVGALDVLAGIGNFIAASIVAGMTIRLVTQLFLAPLRPLQLRTAFVALKKRLKSLMFATLLVGCLSLLGLILLIIPGLIFYVNSSLTSPVVMMENLKGRRAIKRSWELVKRARLTVIAILVIHHTIPAVTQFIVTFTISFLQKVNPQSADIATRVSIVTAEILNIFIIPLIASVTALLYLKARQLGGETLKDVLKQFEEEETPTSKWQMRMRERLHLPTPTSR